MKRLMCSAPRDGSSHEAVRDFGSFCRVRLAVFFTHATSLWCDEQTEASSRDPCFAVSCPRSVKWRVRYRTHVLL